MTSPAEKHSASWPILLAELTSPQSGEAFQAAEMVLIPVGAHEQHGPALPVSTDAITATAMATRAAAMLAPRVLVAPTIPWGVSWHHFGKPGTISLRETTLIAIVVDQIESLARQGVERFVVVNTHGGNNAALTLAVEQAKRDLGVPLVVSLYAYSLLANTARDVMGEHAIGHAGGDEAAAILALRPELVTTDQLGASWQHPDVLRAKRLVTAAGGAMPIMMHKLTPTGVTGDASHATAALGESVLTGGVEQLRDICEELLNLDLKLV